MDIILIVCYLAFIVWFAFMLWLGSKFGQFPTGWEHDENRKAWRDRWKK
jgi:hypothetical protein